MTQPIGYGNATDPTGQVWTPNVGPNTGWNGNSQWDPGQPVAPQGQWTGYQAPPGTGTVTGTPIGSGGPQVTLPGQNPGNAFGANVVAPGTGTGTTPFSGAAGGFYGGGGGGGGPYNFQPSSGASRGVVSYGMTNPVNGMYGAGAANDPLVGAQQKQQKFGIQNDINYGDYQQFGNVAQQYGAAGQGVLNDPRVAGAIAQQQQLAGGPSGYQSAALGNLAQAASGRGPSAAQAQLQAGTEAAQRQALAQAGSARGNFGLANAGKNAMAQGAEGSQQAANQAAQLRAQEMQAAQGQFAQASNTQYQGLVSGAQAAQQGTAAAQNAALNYYMQQQQAAQHQSDTAAQLAQAQVANDFGLGATQLQTQTQQNIANQQTQQQDIAAGVAGTAALIGAFA